MYLSSHSRRTEVSCGFPEGHWHNRSDFAGRITKVRSGPIAFWLQKETFQAASEAMPISFWARSKL